MFIALLSLIAVLSCNQTENNESLLNSTEISDSCRSHPQNSYEVYIPKRAPEAKLPLLIILDPHGKGCFALQKFRYAANTYPSILVASNYIKNGSQDYVKALQELINDVSEKYPVSNSVFVSGFSGGARMALAFAQNKHINGLLLCGALANADVINTLKTSVYSISGTDDFNFVETAQFLFNEQSIPSNLRIELTRQSHSWPDSLLLAEAYGFIYLSDRDAPAPSGSSVKAFIARQNKKIDSLESQKAILEATMLARNLTLTKPFSDEKSVSATYQKLNNSEAFNKQLSQLKSTLEFETKARDQYIRAFSTKDSLWWKNEISTLEQKLKNESDPFKSDMYQRIKSFWGIACYSLGKQAIQNRDIKLMRNIIPVYRMLEPDNAYVYYYAAFPAFWSGNDTVAINLLNKALTAGFEDMDLINQNFPSSVSSQIKH
ncbi:MAG TPA: hypothetical protein PK904_19555 [Bacteroidales bacterium]|nr:hypothetical protein [Bacteroidales bacterium]